MGFPLYKLLSVPVKKVKVIEGMAASGNSGGSLHLEANLGSIRENNIVFCFKTPVLLLLNYLHKDLTVPEEIVLCVRVICGFFIF